jgi:membrane associated rhomboid family serine protease
MKNSAVMSLIVINVVCYFWQIAAPEFSLVHFALWPLGGIAGDPFRLWQPITYAFLHDTHNITHLLFNMLGLWMFGSDVERYLGTPRFLAVYFASVVAAAVTQLLVPPLMGAPPEPTLGASGGVFGVLLAFALMFPQRRVLVFGVLPLPAWAFALLYALIELYSGVTGRMGSVAHFAHLGGMLGSFLVLSQWYFARSRS